MRITLAGTVSALAVFASTIPIQGCTDSSEVTIDFPVLSVVHGSLNPAEGFQQWKLTYTDTNNDRPLVVAIAEDQPGGAGDMLRASVWQAAMVASFFTGENLYGKRITLDSHGSVEGPSAGASICLAIIAAINGQQLPTDYAITGTILPDGTIGQVGGIQHKIRSAHAASKTRVFLPAFQRFETDQDTGETVDLESLSRSLEVQYVPVRDIKEVFDLSVKMERFSEGWETASPRTLPASVDSFLLSTYEKYASQAAACTKALGNEYIEGTLSNDLLYISMANSFGEPSATLSSGDLIQAVDQQMMWTFYICGEEAFRDIVAREYSGDVMELNKKIDSATHSNLNELVSFQEISANEYAEYPILSTQFYTSVPAELEARNVILGLDLMFKRSVLSTVEMWDENKPKIFAQWLSNSWYLFSKFKYVFSEIFLRYSADRDKFGLTRENGSVALTEDAEEVANFLVASFQAASRSFETNVIDSAADSMEVAENDVRRFFASSDVSYQAYRAGRAVVADMSRDLRQGKVGSLERPYFVAILAQIAAVNTARVAGLTIRWTELDLKTDVLFDNFKFEYGNATELDYLLRTARQKAVAKINQCEETGFFCYQPRVLLAQGDMLRDSAEIDKVEILIGYWSAYMQAEAMAMLFERTTP